MALLLAGSLYPPQWVWPPNVRRYEHLAPDQHSAVYSSSRATLNITRREMADSGYCPSGRFFEAAACGTPIVTDWWQGLDHFFDVDRELCVVQTADDVLSFLERQNNDLLAIGERARRRTLEEHTGERRALELLEYCERARHGQRRMAEVTS
jgi:spore maturation protein CgeB